MCRMRAGDEEALSEFITLEKAHSLPANFGSSATAPQEALLNALCNILATSQGGSLPYFPAKACARLESPSCAEGTACTALS